MRSHTAAARTAGVLFICATTADLISRALLQPILGDQDYLTATFVHQDRVLAGVLLLVLAALTSAGIAMALYPVLRRYNEGLALGSVGLRLIEGVFYLVSAAGALLLVSLSQELAGGAPSASITTAGALLLALRDHAGVIGILAFYPGATLYYYVFLRSRLVPRWLSGWGIAATTLGLTAAVLVFLGVIAPFSTPQIVMNLPIFLNELVLAVWLILRGFATPAPAAKFPSVDVPTPVPA